MKRNHRLFSNFTILFCFVLSIFLLTDALAAEVPKISKEELQAMLGNLRQAVTAQLMRVELVRQAAKVLTGAGPYG